MNRRSFARLSAAAAGAALVGVHKPVAAQDLPEPIRSLKPWPGAPTPISDDERHARIEKARRLMAENRLDAILLEPGSSFYYYTGARANAGEKVFSLVLPAKGDLVYVIPSSEEARKPQFRLSQDIRVWQESESPYKRIIQALKERGLSHNRIGIEERARFFIFDGLRQESPSLEFVNATPVTAGCRVIKSPAEIALMQRANDITLAAYKAAHDTAKEGMTNREFDAMTSAAFRALGVTGGATAQFGQYSAFPHGSIQPQHLKEGDIILMDGGTNIEGYASDLTRTFVYGKPSARQRQIWALERKAQDAALAAAKVGATCESVDAAARKVITDFGFGPDYKVPGLPHRTGHGIGLDGHEWTNFVRGNKTKIQPGMCFSDEPMIAIYGEFGVRLEDCMHITESAGKMFTPQSPSIDHPFGT